MTGPTQGQGPSATPPARGPALANGQQKKLVIKPLKRERSGFCVPRFVRPPIWRRSAAPASCHAASGIQRCKADHET